MHSLFWRIIAKCSCLTLGHSDLYRYEWSNMINFFQMRPKNHESLCPPWIEFCGRLIRRADSLEKTLMLGKIEGGWRSRGRGWDDWMHHWLNGNEFEQTRGSTEGQGSLGCFSPWGCKNSEKTEWVNNNVYNWFALLYCRNQRTIVK